MTTLTTRIPGQLARLDRLAAGCAVLAVALASLAWAFGLHGPDLAAQLHRIEFFKHSGFALLDLQWFGGHYPLAYSVLLPPLGALLGAGVLAAGCAGAAAWAFARLLREHFGAKVAIGAVWFAVGTAAMVVIGQLAFLLGAVLALLALVAQRADRRYLAWLLLVLVPLASPVDAALLLIVFAARWLVASGPARRHAVLAGAVVCCVLAAMELPFRQGGTFPFAATTLVGVLGVAVGGFVLLPKHEKALRVGAVIYGVIGLVMFFVPQPMGANLGRLGTAVAGPIAVTVLWPKRRVLLVLLAAPLLFWQWAPVVTAAAAGTPDPSRQDSYFAPVLKYLKPRLGDDQRVEIPTTTDHWEARWAARAVPLARGWERQVDNKENPVFYHKHLDLDPATYAAWLHHQGVGWVAVPDVKLDYSGRPEAALISHGLPYLRLAWSNRHWKVYRVLDSTTILNGPGKLVSVGHDRFVLDASATGPTEVRVKYTRYWSVVSGKACLTRAPDGWTEVRVLRPGRIDVSAKLLGADKPPACHHH